MKRPMLELAAVFLTAMLTFAVAGCASSKAPSNNPCNQSLLERFEATNEAKYSYSLFINFLLADGASKDGRWVISQRGDGCAVIYQVTLNGRQQQWMPWYIDLKTRTVYPDDSATRQLVQMMASKPSVLSK